MKKLIGIVTILLFFMVGCSAISDENLAEKYFSNGQYDVRFNSDGFLYEEEGVLFYTADAKGRIDSAYLEVDFENKGKQFGYDVISLAMNLDKSGIGRNSNWVKSQLRENSRNNLNTFFAKLIDDTIEFAIIELHQENDYMLLPIEIGKEQIDHLIGIIDELDYTVRDLGVSNHISDDPEYVKSVFESVYEAGGFFVLKDFEDYASDIRSQTISGKWFKDVAEPK